MLAVVLVLALAQVLVLALAQALVLGLVLTEALVVLEQSEQRSRISADRRPRRSRGRPTYETSNQCRDELRIQNSHRFDVLAHTEGSNAGSQRSQRYTCQALDQRP
jgi:hypothetical protein